ncbi:leucine-rich repeat-containing protein 27-like isoform X2 [Actinia tenebrosa]|uniref:Leucine-rich repeat-containing protein 27-like isoform X2 n=1 Tax=Actinia tenebrosa TaxID=6105 RepID=A0A6P8H4N2_ACTTE|nr:leucine-rich repeat-containing protein 27-like isoform X2 [Actinia tenebrosa]
MSKGKQHHNKMAVGEESGLKRVEQLIKTAIALGNTTIDLGSKNLTEIPSEILDLPQLEFLYLEGNKITAFPEGFFENLPNLKWLDVRNNRISEIPTSVGSHRCLRNLLLEGNEIKELPLELGFAKCLSGLNLTSNPLEMPPSQVLERGTQEVLKFLREKYAEKMGLNGQESFLKEVSQSSSEEDLGYGSRDYQTKEHSSWSLPRRKTSTETADPDLRPTHTPVSFHRPPSRPDQIRMQYDRQRAYQHSAERERRHSWSKERNIEEMSNSPANGPRRLSRPTMQKKQSPAFDRTRYNASASPRFPDYEAKIAEHQQMAITAILNEKEDSVLQKLKDKKALSDWRDKTRRIKQQKQQLATLKNPPKGKAFQAISLKHSKS